MWPSSLLPVLLLGCGSNRSDPAVELVSVDEDIDSGSLKCFVEFGESLQNPDNYVITPTHNVLVCLDSKVDSDKLGPLVDLFEDLDKSDEVHTLEKLTLDGELVTLETPTFADVISYIELALNPETYEVLIKGGLILAYIMTEGEEAVTDLINVSLMVAQKFDVPEGDPDSPVREWWDLFRYVLKEKSGDIINVMVDFQEYSDQNPLEDGVLEEKAQLTLKWLHDNSSINHESGSNPLINLLKTTLEDNKTIQENEKIEADNLAEVLLQMGHYFMVEAPFDIDSRGEELDFEDRLIPGLFDHLALVYRKGFLQALPGLMEGLYTYGYYEGLDFKGMPIKGYEELVWGNKDTMMSKLMGLAGDPDDLDEIVAGLFEPQGGLGGKTMYEELADNALSYYESENYDLVGLVGKVEDIYELTCEDGSETATCIMMKEAVPLLDAVVNYKVDGVSIDQVLAPPVIFFLSHPGSGQIIQDTVPYIQVILKLDFLNEIDFITQLTVENSFMTTAIDMLPALVNPNTGRMTDLGEETLELLAWSLDEVTVENEAGEAYVLNSPAETMLETVKPMIVGESSEVITSELDALMDSLPYHLYVNREESEVPNQDNPLDYENFANFLNKVSALASDGTDDEAPFDADEAREYYTEKVDQVIELTDKEGLVDAGLGVAADGDILDHVYPDRPLTNSAVEMVEEGKFDRVLQFTLRGLQLAYDKYQELSDD